MGRRDGDGECSSCHATFEYYLIHNGFNDSAFGYCDSCGMTALFSAWSKTIPEGVELNAHGPIALRLEPFIGPCVCGGHFRADAPPRCVQCRAPLDAVASTIFIEKNAPATKAGWRWQRSWKGLYAIVIDDRCVDDPWSATGR
jgi:hypothetical protein